MTKTPQVPALAGMTPLGIKPNKGLYEVQVTLYIRATDANEAHITAYEKIANEPSDAIEDMGVEVIDNGGEYGAINENEGE